MDRLARALASLLSTCADCVGGIFYSVTCEVEAPPGAKRLGSQALMPGYIVFRISTKNEVHFVGYWQKTE